MRSHSPIALAALLALAVVVPRAAAQCPVPAPAVPVLDGSLDPVYLQRGFTTDYVAYNVNARARLHQLDDICVDSQFIYLAWEIDLGFVDNSYGLNRNQGARFPWPAGHDFFDLTESDGQRLQILNVCGEDVVDIFMDYIDGPNVPGPEYGTPSGYEVVQPSSCAGATCAETTKFLINGGDWTMYTYDTSLAYNLNDLGFCSNDGPGGLPPDCDDAGTDLLVDSPPWANEDDFIPQSPYDDWEYRHIYEIRIDRSVFTTAACPQGTPALIRTDPVELHASPSKIGESPVDLFRAYSTIGDYVWLDADRDGVQDVGEPGLANVTLDLYRDDGDGVFEPDTAVTDGFLDVNGDGVIDAADDGTVAGVTVIDGLLDLDGDGVAGETNGDDSGTLNTVTVIDGRLDIDGDADVDAFDDGLFAGEDGSPPLSTVTGARGGYSFTRLGAGNYFVDVTDDNGVLAGLTLTIGPQSETDPTAVIVLPLQNEYLLADFGYAPADPTTAVVGNFIWSDADNDGIQDPSEAGIGGVTVDLVDADTMSVVATTITAASGRYLFTGVAPGNYYVDVTDTGGVLAGYALTVGPQSETDPSAAFQVAAGDVYLNADFGYFNPALGALGNLVWFDVDEDAVVDAGEPGLGNVTLDLIVDADGDGIWDPGEPIIAGTTTASDGSYAFTGLVLDDGGGDGDADYLVWVSDLEDVIGQFLESIFLPLGSTADNVGKLPPYALDLSAGLPVDNTADFGYMVDDPLGLLGDRIWYDDDGDGVQDPTEPGIEGIVLVLYNDLNKNGLIDPLTDDVIATWRTDVNGNYYFQRLAFDMNGEGYIVVVSQFSGFDVLDGLLDLDGDGVGGGPGDDGTVDGITIIDGRLDLDGDGTIETNGDDSGTVSGFKVIHGEIDLDLDGNAGETNGDDSRFGALRNFTQTGDPDESGTCSVCDARSASVLSSAAPVDLNRDFGYDGVGTLQIGDTVYHDLDGSGTQDAGEPGFELVTLALYQDLDGDGVVDANEPLIAEQVTDGNGNYLFSDVIAGDYVVAITDDNGILIGYTQTQGAPFEPVASAELSTLDKDFGFVRRLPATISNFVWEDLDGDGFQDAGEPGVPNVSVSLYDPGGDGMPGGGDDVLVGATTTDAGGIYSFTVQTGDYFVAAVAPPGYAMTLRDQGADDAIDSDFDALTGQASVTNLIINENDPTWDLGLYRPVAVGDRVWFDVDGDGVQDAGEPGIANVYLDLYDAGPDLVPGGGDDVRVGTLVTDGDGEYFFLSRPPDTYYVDVIGSTVPAGLALSGGTDPSSSSTLLSGQAVFTKDFGYTDDGNAVIGDFVWSDADADGLQDDGEVGIGGVTLDLVSAGADGVLGTADDVVEATVTTAPDGSYLFTGVAAGEYVVDVTDTGGVLAGYNLTAGPQSSSDPTAPITVAAGDVYLRADFGYFQAGLGTIGTHVWMDGDDDGIRDAGEAGISGVTLALAQDGNGDGVWDADGADDAPGTSDDEALIATTRTAADGSYSFTGLALDDGGGDGDADYLVVVTDTGNVLDGLALTTGPVPGADDNSQVVPYPVALSAAPGDNDPTADFGYNRPGTIGDRVWSDADGDGVQDVGEAGIGGVTLDLLGPGPDGMIGTGDDVVLATETTAADGSYLFTLLLPDDYRVVVTDAGGILAGYAPTGDPDEAGTCSVCDGESTTTLAAGDSDLTRDFGYRNAALANISGTVFYDTDRDGFHDEPPEVGIGGVTMKLWHDVDGNGVLDPAVDELVATTVTDAVGNYLFADLPDDDYVVAVSDDAGVLDAYTLTSGRDQIAVELMGVDVTDVDFGYVRDGVTAAIGDTVWIDADGDGQPGPAEAGIPGVILDLYADVDGDGVLEPTVSVIDGRIDLDGDGDVDAFDDGELGGVRIVDGYVDVDGDGIANETNGEDDGTFNGATVDDGLIDLDGDGTAGETNGDDTGALAGDDGAPLATTITAADGRYLFDGLAAGSYFVDVREGTLPDTTADGTPDLVETTYPAGVEPADAIALSDGERYLDADFGYLPAAGTALLGDRVWYDVDGDGLQDPGEAGIEGVTIILQDGVCSSFATCPQAVTGADGIYYFTGLAPGDYSVTFDPATLPAGVNTTPTNNGGETTYNVTANAGDAFYHLDFGFNGGAFGTVGDLVWFDLDGDGDRDAGEAGVEGVTINLVRDTDGDGVWDPDGADGLFGTADDEPILATAATTTAGAYLFSGLPLTHAGDGDASDADYLVDVTDVDGVLAGLQKTSGLAATNDNSQDDPYAVALSAAPGDSDLTADFGYTAAARTGSIGNLVFRDLDGDGVRAAGESGIEGVTLDLWHDVNGDGVITQGVDNLIRTTVTDVNGEYSFNALPLGDYLVDVTDTAGVLTGFTKTSGTVGADDNSQADPYAVSLDAATPENLTADFGYEAPPATSYTIAGTVFADDDRDAFFDAGIEAVVSGARLLLYRDLDGDGRLDPEDPLIATTTSDGAGDYLFTDLPAGDFLVAANVTSTTVDGFVQSTQTATAGVQPVTLPTTNPPDPGAPNSTDNDFGFWNGGITTTPVTLAWFKAEAGAAGTVFEWATATEAGNVGFNLYRIGGSELARLNEELIPSAVVDSLAPQVYRFEAPEIEEGGAFLLEDVDLRGDLRYHGPFRFGEEYGRPVAGQLRAIDWGRIRAGHREARARRGRAFAAAPRRGYPQAVLRVSADGIFRVTYEELLAAGVDLGGALLRDLAVLERGEPVPVRVEGKGRFGPGAFVEFVGRGLDTLYTRDNVYILMVDASRAVRVSEDRRPPRPWSKVADSYRESVRVERDLTYHFASPTDDPWAEALLLALSSPASHTVPFELDNRVPGAGAVEVEVAISGLTDFDVAPDHHVIVEVNGVQLAEDRFDGQAGRTIRFEVPEGLLSDAANELRVVAPNDTGAAFDLLLYDGYRVSYPRRFEAREGRLEFTAAGEAFRVAGLVSAEVVVYREDEAGTSLLRPRVETGAVVFEGSPVAARYLVAAASAVLAPVIEPASPPAGDLLSGAAELLIVAHPDFVAGVAPLAQARRAEGWLVKVVDVTDLYRSFSHGVFGPEAIRAYIQLAHAELGVQHVLLVGGDTYDYHDYLGVGSLSFIPTPYAQTDPIVRYAPVDPLYGDVDGDGLPDLSVGRLPVRTPAELTLVIEKTLSFRGAAAAVLAADDFDLASNFSFTAASDEMAAMLPPSWTVTRAYLDELAVAEARELLLTAMNGGTGLVSYFGHSGPTVWSFDGLFASSDVDALENDGEPWVVTQWGCWNTYHVLPTYDTLGHLLLLGGEHGAAAVLGAATLTDARSERALGRRIYRHLTEPGTTLGEAIRRAKAEMAATEPDRLDVLLGWTLLGDPTLQPRR